MSNDRLVKSVTLQASSEIKFTSNSPTQTNNNIPNDLIVQSIKIEFPPLPLVKTLMAKNNVTFLLDTDSSVYHLSENVFN